MTNRMIAPKNDWKNDMTEKDELVAAPMVPMRNPKNA